ncbi:MAG TPA: antitoxin, partial [Acidimicrobiia bacterium]
MRTTIDLPDDIHRIARAIAVDSDRSLSETVTML